jgi:hypothetical protein
MRTASVSEWDVVAIADFLILNQARHRDKFLLQNPTVVG